jgi:uncharacterized protein (TIGR03437 family)
VSIYGSNLATTATSATSVPLPTNLGGVSVTITDSSSIQTPLPLFYTGPTQINADIPDSVNTGAAVLTIASPSGPLTSAVTLVTVAPGLISANGDGKGVAAAQVVTAHADGSQSVILPFQCPGGAGTCVPVPINLGPASDQSALVLYGTGIRNRASLSDVTVKLGGLTLPATYAGAAPTFVGLDQVNVFLPHSLAGSGNANVSITVAGTASNVLALSFQ